MYKYEEFEENISRKDMLISSVLNIKMYCVSQKCPYVKGQ